MKRATPALVLLTAACQLTDPPPREYRLDEVTWAHPAMAGLVERMTTLVAERHPDWVWLPLRWQSLGNYYAGGWCPRESVNLDAEYAIGRCASTDRTVWLSLGGMREPSEPLPVIADLWVALRDDAPVAGGHVSAFIVLLAGEERRGNSSDLTLTTSSRALVHPDAKIQFSDITDLRHGKAFADLGLAPDEGWSGLAPDTYVGLDLLGYVLEGPGQLQNFLISRYRWKRDVELGVVPFWDGRSFDQFLTEVMPWYSRGSSSWGVEAKGLYDQKMEAIRRERKEEIRVPRSIAQTEAQSMYATLVEVIPRDLVINLKRRSATATPAK